MSNSFFWLLIGLLGAQTITQLVLSELNWRFIAQRRGEIPDFLKEHLDLETKSRSTDYSGARLRFGQVKLLWDRAFLFGALFLGFFPWLDERSQGKGMLFLIALGVINFLVELPFSLYSTFVLENRFGFNKTTLKLFFADVLKAAGLSLILGIPLYWIAEKIYFGLGSYWWAATWGVLFLFSLFVTWVFPEYIAPLFNKFWNLDDPEILTQIQQLSEKTGFVLKRVQVMDASRRSHHSNAYFTGFGKTKKIVLFDTLLKQVPTRSLMAVLAHELGHFKLKHVIKGLILSQAVSFFAFAALGYFTTQNWFFESLGLNHSFHGALVLFSILSSTIGFWWQPLSSYLSRKHEFEADRYAREIMAESDSLKTALIILSKENLSAPEPHPIYSNFYYSHPPLGERIAALN